MSISKRLFYGLISMSGVTFVTLSTGHAAVYKDKNFEISYANLPREDVTAAASEIRTAIAQLSRFFGKPLRRKVRIEVMQSGRFPVVYDKDFRITYPESRIRLAGRFRDPSFVHDLAILFEHAKEDDHKGLLTIGLATYLQDNFAVGKNVYPTDGEPLHAKTAAVMDQEDWIIPLGKTTIASKAKRMTRIRRRIAMLEQGSFVGFLIERYGQGKFLRLYRGADFRTLYGISRCRAENAWFASLIKLRPALARFVSSQSMCP